MRGLDLFQFLPVSSSALQETLVLMHIVIEAGGIVFLLVQEQVEFSNGLQVRVVVGLLLLELILMDQWLAPLGQAVVLNYINARIFKTQYTILKLAALLIALQTVRAKFLPAVRVHTKLQLLRGHALVVHG